MEQTSFELTPTQKGLLATLSSETGKPVPTLLAEALEALQAREQQRQETPAPLPPPPTTSKPLWAVFAEVFQDVPEEELARLPVDGAAQHDHYIYGWPKREL